MSKLILLLLTLLWASPNEVQYHYYFPIVLDIPAVGVAWYPTPNSQADASLLGAYWWYNSSSCLSPKPQAIPILRKQYFETCKEGLNRNYKGLMLVGNEGEFIGQDHLSPEEMAAFILQVKQQWPQASLICFNSTDADYINSALALLPRGTCRFVGVHLAFNNDVSEFLDEINFGNFIVTEVGWPYSDSRAYEIVKSQVCQSIQDGRISMIFAYTTGEAMPPENAMIVNGRLMPNGLGFIDGLNCLTFLRN